LDSKNCKKIDFFLEFLQLTRLPHHSDPHKIPQISSYIDSNAKTEQYLLPVDILEKRFQVLDICTLDSTNSICFTKSYSRYLEGTGSVFCNMTRNEFDLNLKLIESNSQPKSSLQLRFFTPKEVLRLMSFPETFLFPSTVNEKQQYKLLGNSINVAVVSELIKILFNE
jgi:tRNA (cytosine38-C5)-methyltransferase